LPVAALAAAVLFLGLSACQAAGAEVKSRINPKDGAEMVYVPAGDFTMGSKEGEGYASEHPQHKVYLDGFWIYKNDVTVAEYRKFCEATGRTMPHAPGWGWKDDHPVVNVAWDDAAAYAGWAKVHLPTEAQWEKAARGTDGRIYPWGNDWDKTKANSVDSGLKATTPVGSYPGGASPYGCMDMAGNVWQWCADWYDDKYYANSPAKNPAGPATGTFRVLRGGSWYFSDNCRSAFRFNFIPSGRLNFIGFRCVGPAGLP
jgi:formylglycine-generating enzyme required for sulfatase activity